MRTTLTLDDDVAAHLRSAARRSGRPFREIVNETIREGLAARDRTRDSTPFKVNARDLGRLQPGISLDNIAELLETIEGPMHR
ncbi:MAG: hypothetical protein Q8P61_07070 [Candidatus Nanopelagicales bacterium]|nr:hypothetical protein [Candidatus Nanopelagicales bacterium]